MSWLPPDRSGSSLLSRDKSPGARGRPGSGLSAGSIEHGALPAVQRSSVLCAPGRRTAPSRGVRRLALGIVPACCAPNKASAEYLGKIRVQALYDRYTLFAFFARHTSGPSAEINVSGTRSRISGGSSCLISPIAPCRALRDHGRAPRTVLSPAASPLLSSVLPGPS